AAFSQSGTYILRLTAGDTQFTPSDDVTVNVNPANQPPVVNAGPDLTVTLPDSATLNGTVTDDGLATTSILTITRTKSRGPGTLPSAPPRPSSDLASFSQSGTYILRLTAGDTQFTPSDDVTVTVNPANQSPVVNAGPDLTVTLPDSATLNGS